MPSEKDGEGVTVNNVSSGNTSNVNLSMQDGREATNAADNTVTPESLGVSQTQFDKFFDKEKGYNWQGHAQEAEYKLTQRGETRQTDNTSRQQAQTNASPSDAKTAVSEAGLDFGDLTQKIVDNGDIDAADYKALSDIGIPEHIAKSYVQGEVARATEQVDNVLAAFGGEAGFGKVKAWVQENYTDAEVADLERKLSSPNEYRFTAEFLLSKAGLPPVEKGHAVNAPNASQGGGGGAEGYKNQAEMIADQKDPRYRKDPKFREQVYARAAASTFTVNPRAHGAGL